MSPRLLFALVAFVAAASLVSAASCGFGGVDLSPLTRSDLTTIDEATRRWVLRPCGVVDDSQCRRQGNKISTCMIGAGAMAPISYGDWTGDSRMQWSYIDSAKPSAGVQLYMQGGTSASGCNHVGYFYSNVIFACAAQQGDMIVDFEPKSCYANYTVPTPLACGNAREAPLLAEF